MSHHPEPQNLATDTLAHIRTLLPKLLNKRNQQVRIVVVQNLCLPELVFNGKVIAAEIRDACLAPSLSSR
jgi:hypothetical protein